MIFEKTSTRTRCAFEVAAFDQGAHVTYLDPTGSQMGHKESIADTAQVLGRMFDAIEYRGSGQENVEELARFAGVPVYNGLTDEWHPTQMLADFLTMEERATATARRDRLRVRRRRPLQHGPLAARDGCDPRLRCAACGPARAAPPDEVVRDGRRSRREIGRPDHDHRRRRGRGQGRRLRPHRRLGLDGRAEGGLGGAGQDARAVPGERRAARGDRATRT